jgi:hypothetical protein
MIQVEKDALKYDLIFDFGAIKRNNNLLVDVILAQRNFLLKDCIILGNRIPLVNEKGVIIFVSKAKYPCFLPLTFFNENIFSPGDFYYESGNMFIDISQLDAEFLNKVQEICNRLGILVNSLLIIMLYESGFNPKARNKKSRATGILQFLPSTAISLGTTVEQIYLMTRVQQLDLVEKYLQPYSGRVKNFQDLCMAVFYPAYIGKASDTKFPEKVTRVNPGIITIQNYVNSVLSVAKSKSGSVRISSEGFIGMEN